MRDTRVESLTEKHIICRLADSTDGPTLVAIGSIHGNEPSGRLALERVALRLKSLREKLRGRVYLIIGNVRASERAVRFIDSDLNRHWRRENIRQNTRLESGDMSEDLEQHELLTIFREILQSARGEVYALDLHSTSAGGQPFATVGDTLRNRRFAQRLPVTILLGIEEQLEGTLLEFLSNEGVITLGFEAGQHGATESIDNHESLVTQAIVNAGILEPDDVPLLDQMRHQLAVSTGHPSILEIRHREPVAADDDFQMKPGFKNFDPVTRGESLARNRYGTIRASESGLILMPLYQKQGEDGFFIARKIAPVWLRVSEVLRRLKIPDYIHFLPGVRRSRKHPEIAYVDTAVARFFPLQVFHLLGFRRLEWRDKFLVVTRRRYDTDSPFVH